MDDSPKPNSAWALTAGLLLALHSTHSATAAADFELRVSQPV